MKQGTTCGKKIKLQFYIIQLDLKKELYIQYCSEKLPNINRKTVKYSNTVKASQQNMEVFLFLETSQMSGL
jgi:hypothetical protein